MELLAHDNEIKEEKILTDKCWKSHARMMFVATLGKIPRFFCRLAESLSSPSPSVPSPEPILLSAPSSEKIRTWVRVGFEPTILEL